MFRKILCMNIFVLIFSGFASAQESGINSADDCMDCHRNHYTEWKSSAHGNSSAARDPLYSAMMQWAIRDAGSQLETTCKSCHEPTRLHPVNAVQTQALFDEGVTCDICHAAYPGENGRLENLNPTKEGVKLGPFKGAIANVHSSEFNANLQKSVTCLQCHNQMISSRNDLEICVTGPEWEETEYREMGVECQDCHMVSKSGKAARLGKLRDNIHDHSFVGVSEEVLRVAVDFGMEVTTKDDSLLITIQIKNRGAGHHVPTGTPLRSIILTVRVMDKFEQVLWKNWRNK